MTKDKDVLKRMRIELGLTQKVFGKRLGVTQSAVSHWECGISYPAVPISAKIAKLLDKHYAKKGRK
jgi:transcriptional regulator with XRE-family HTH domain